MSEPFQVLPNADFSDSVESKAASRRQDAADVAAGRRTAAEVQRENTRWLIGDASRAVFLNEHEAYEAL